MPNGKPGDHPYTDIVIHKFSVYSPEVDELIRQIDALPGGADLLDGEFGWNWGSSPDEEKLDQMQHLLKAIRSRLARE